MMDNEILVSVCIANYNGVGVIDSCLNSVLEQLGSIKIEILVHDDASSDGSVSHIRDRHRNVQLMISDTNVGFCVANNRMAYKAQGKYLLFLNNDAALFPDALQALITEANLLEHPAILSLPQYDFLTGNLIDRGCLLDPFFNPVPNLDPIRQDVAMVIGACLWIPKALWEELGGFPEWFGSIAEDMYLCCRARLSGSVIRALTRSGYRHHQGKSFGGNQVRGGRLHTTYKRRVLSEINKTYVLILTSPPLQLGILLPLHLSLILLEGLLISVQKMDLILWQSVYSSIPGKIWQRRKTLLSLRREIQNDRSISLKKWLSGFVILPRKVMMLLKHGMPYIR